MFILLTEREGRRRGVILLFVFVVFSSRSSCSKVQVGPSLGFGIPEPILSLLRRLRLAGAERGSRASQEFINQRCGRVRTAEHAPRDPFRILERRYGLAVIGERRAGILVERLRVKRLLEQLQLTFGCVLVSYSPLAQC